MPLFTVDADKCNRDNICAAECPVKIIRVNQGGVPTPVDGAQQVCIECGHCVAVCPTGALVHEKLRPEDCAPVKKEWLLTPEQAEHFLRYRRSIRTYKEKQVSRDILERLIHIARYAPSGHNTQPVRWQVIYDKDEVRRLSGYVAEWMRHMLDTAGEMAKSMHFDLVVGAWDLGVDVISRDAPHLILANGPAANPASQTACIIAMTYLDLAAPSLGLGTCWNGFFNAAALSWKPLQEALGLKPGEKNFAAMMVGYPGFRYHRMPERNAPKIKWS